MQTTLRIQDELYREAKAQAAREGVSLTRFLEEALRSKLQNRRLATPGEPHPFPVSTPKGPLKMSDDELKRVAQEEEFTHDLEKMGLAIPEA